MDSLATRNETPVGALRWCPVRQARKPGERHRDRPPIRKVRDQSIIGLYRLRSGPVLPSYGGRTPVYSVTLAGTQKCSSLPHQICERLFRMRIQVRPSWPPTLSASFCGPGRPTIARLSGNGSIMPRCAYSRARSTALLGSGLLVCFRIHVSSKVDSSSRSDPRTPLPPSIRRRRQTRIPPFLIDLAFDAPRAAVTSATRTPRTRRRFASASRA